MARSVDNAPNPLLVIFRNVQLTNYNEARFEPLEVSINVDQL